MNLEEFEDDFMKIDPRSRTAAAGQQSPAARQLSEWFRQLGRLVRIARTYGPYAPLARQNRERVVLDLLPLLEYHAPLVLRFSPLEIWLRSELLMRAEPDDEGGPSLEHQLPFLLYRDGLRGLTFAGETTREEIATIVGAILEVTSASLTHDDLCTLLWESDLPNVRVDSAPLELAIENDRGTTTIQPPTGERAGSTSASGAEWIDDDPYASIVREPATQKPASGLTGEHQEDWVLRGGEASAASLWREMHLHEQVVTEPFLQQWKEEDKDPWSGKVEAFIGEVVKVDSSPDMREALAGSIVTWFASAVQRCDWPEAQHGLDVLHKLEAQPTQARHAMRDALSGLDLDAITSRLDESSPEDQARFFSLVVSAGPGALDLTIGVLGRAGRARLRAAATTALSYLCHEEPQLLAPYLADTRWHVVRNIVFVLGQVGGPAVTDLLARAARHLDSRVRRAAVTALAQVPARQRTPLLLEHLDTHDPQLLHSTLALLGREKDTQVALSLLARINADDFETRSDEHRLAMIAVLGDVADDGAVPALEQLLHKGGWFARRSPERTAAARTLARIGTASSLQILEAGAQSRAEAVRAACLEALQSQARS